MQTCYGVLGDITNQHISVEVLRDLCAIVAQIYHTTNIHIFFLALASLQRLDTISTLNSPLIHRYEGLNFCMLHTSSIWAVSLGISPCSVWGYEIGTRGTIIGIRTILQSRTHSSVKHSPHPSQIIIKIRMCTKAKDGDPNLATQRTPTKYYNEILQLKVS